MITFLKAKESKVKKRKHLIPIKKTGLNFGSNKIYIYFAFIIIFIIIMQLIIYFLLYDRAIQVTNMIKLYSSIAETWENYGSITTLVIELVTWNGEVKFWEQKKDPLEEYNVFKKRIEEVIIPTFAESVTYNLGNYTETHKKFINVRKYN